MGRDSDLYELLLFLKKQDVRTFLKLKEYINASISRTNEKEQRLFNHLAQLKISDFRKFNTQKACDFLRLKTKEVYPIQQKLLKHIEQFLIHEEMQKDSNLQRNTLLKVYKKYDMKKMFNATIKRKLLIGSTDYLHKKYEAHLIECHWIAKQNRDKQSSSLKITSEYFQHYYATEALRLRCMKLAQNPTMDLLMPDEYPLMLSPYKEVIYRQKFPITYLYYLIYTITIHRTEQPNKQTLENYELLESCIFGAKNTFLNRKQLKHECRIDAFAALQNFCVFQISYIKDAFNQQKYLTKLSQLIAQGQEQGLLKEMSNNIFITTIITWIKLKDYDIARKFLDDKKSRFLLLEKYRECTPHLAEALYYHYTSENETNENLKTKYISKSYFYLNKVLGTEEMKDINHRSYIDLIWVKMDIQTKDFIDTLARLDRFYNFLNKKGVKRYNLTIRYMKRFILYARPLQEEGRPSLEHSTSDLEALVEDLKKENNFPLKDWIIEKALAPFLDKNSVPELAKIRR